MRTLSSLQKRKVETESGRSLGRCHDLRGELTGSKLRVTGLCVGQRAWLEHFGVTSHEQHTVVRWEAVVRIEGKRIVVCDDAHPTARPTATPFRGGTLARRLAAPRAGKELRVVNFSNQEDPMAGSDQEQGPVKPSEQRGGTTPDKAEAREKGSWAGTAAEGIVPAELGGSDAPREMLPEDPELGSAVLGRTTGSDEPTTEDGIDPAGGDNADATSDGGPDLPEGEEPDLKDAATAQPWADAEPAG